MSMPEERLTPSGQHHGDPGSVAQQLEQATYRADYFYRQADQFLNRALLAEKIRTAAWMSLRTYFSLLCARFWYWWISNADAHYLSAEQYVICQRILRAIDHYSTAHRCIMRGLLRDPNPEQEALLLLGEVQCRIHNQNLAGARELLESRVLPRTTRLGAAASFEIYYGAACLYLQAGQKRLCHDYVLCCSFLTSQLPGTYWTEQVQVLFRLVSGKLR